MLTAVLMASAWACGDDDGGDNITAGDGDGSSSTADGGGEEGASCVGELDIDESGDLAMDYLCNTDPSADPDADNACRNESDCAIINTDEVRELAKNCGLAARGMEADCDKYYAFNEDCVISETRTKIMDPGLSRDCAGCYAATLACGTRYCLTECAADADTPDCIACQLLAGCRLPFERCSGLERE